MVTHPAAEAGPVVEHAAIQAIQVLANQGEEPAEMSVVSWTVAARFDFRRLGFHQRPDFQTRFRQALGLPKKPGIGRKLDLMRDLIRHCALARSLEIHNLAPFLTAQHQVDIRTLGWSRNTKRTTTFAELSTASCPLRKKGNGSGQHWQGLFYFLAPWRFSWEKCEHLKLGPDDDEKPANKSAYPLSGYWRPAQINEQCGYEGRHGTSVKWFASRWTSTSLKTGNPVNRTRCSLRLI